MQYNTMHIAVLLSPRVKGFPFTQGALYYCTGCKSGSFGCCFHSIFCLHMVCTLSMTGYSSLHVCSQDSLKVDSSVTFWSSKLTEAWETKQLCAPDSKYAIRLVIKSSAGIQTCWIANSDYFFEVGHILTYYVYTAIKEKV